MVPDMAPSAVGRQVVRGVIRGVAVDVVNLQPAIPAAPLAAPIVTIEHEPAERGPSVSG